MKLLKTWQTPLQQMQQAMMDHLDPQLPFLEALQQALSQSTKPPLHGLTLLLSATEPKSLSSEWLTVSTVLSYLHTATQLHDAIGETASTRRLQQEISDIWNNEASILIGDYLLSMSFQLLSQLGNIVLLESIASTTTLIAQGQVLSAITPSWMQAPQNHSQLMEYKVASLFGAAAKSAAILENKDTMQQNQHYQQGMALGMALQLVEHTKTPTSEVFDQIENYRKQCGELSEILDMMMDSQE